VDVEGGSRGEGVEEGQRGRKRKGGEEGGYCTHQINTHVATAADMPLTMYPQLQLELIRYSYEPIVISGLQLVRCTTFLPTCYISGSSANQFVHCT